MRPRQIVRKRPPEWRSSSRFLHVVVVRVLLVGGCLATVSCGGSSDDPADVVAPPMAPTGLSVVAVGRTDIVIGWTDNATDETGYEVWKCTGSGCSDVAQIATLGVDAIAYADRGLAESTTYRYQVRAYNLGGPSTFSNAAEGTTFDFNVVPDLGNCINPATNEVVASGVTRAQCAEICPTCEWTSRV
jgi:hypothetical protein